MINVCKLVIKDLIDTSLFSDRRSLESESNELKHFFIVLENIFMHGFKGFISFYSEFIDNINKLCKLMKEGEALHYQLIKEI